MLYKVIGLELASRPFKDDPYEHDSHIVDKSYGTVVVRIRPLTENELAEYNNAILQPKITERQLHCPYKDIRQRQGHGHC